MMKFCVPKFLQSALFLSAALLLASCGGGGSGDAGVFTLSVGGSISQLNGTVVLQNKGTDNLAVSTNGTFTFPALVAYGDSYNVSVFKQPANQRCMVANGSGIVAARVSDVSLICASQLGGAMQGVALKLDPTVSTLAGSAYGFDGTGAAATFNSPNSVASDGTFLYVADSNKIRKIEIASGKVTTLAGTGEKGAKDGAGATATFRDPAGIAIDLNNADLYVADSGNNKIRKIVIATGVVSSFTGVEDTASSVGFADGQAGVATFNAPTGIANDGMSVYVADSGNNKIRVIDIANQTVYSLLGDTSVAGTRGALDSATAMAQIPPLLPQFNNPVGISAYVTVNGTTLYVADQGNNKIRMISFGSTVSSLTGTADTAGAYGATDGAGPAASFSYPVGITNDGTNLYVVDSGSNKIRKIVSSGGSLSSMSSATAVVSSLTGSANTLETAGAVNGVGATAKFNWPGGITAVGSNLYVADTDNNIIRTVDASANVGTLAGTAMGTDGTGAAAGFGQIGHGITSDGANLYEADSHNNKIRKIVIATGEVTTVAGTGETGAKDGDGATATFDGPYGITTDGTNLYVVDKNNNKIRKIVIATGVVSSLTGVADTAEAAGALDGAGATATFDAPHDITTDGVSLYVSDSYNNKIRKIAPSSGTLSSMTSATAVVSSFTGVANTPIPSPVSGSVDGSATTATFDFPWGITTDGINLYVADWGSSYKIRKVEIATGVVTTLAGTGIAGAKDGVGTEATFIEPQGITTDGANLYVVDQSSNKIRKIAPSVGTLSSMTSATAVVSSLTGVASTPGAVGAADGAGADATFNYPHGITTDGSSLFVVDDHTIRKIQ